ncbi:hypothetical protein JM93_01757 [Roseibium hamelinense]|uniref:Uncharacterized protein n=1 Tax=Roseibium hamelinense TaxID=150831 RepID=A0A562T8K7_9HYPH|nr:DUF6505 family protein [Roseibium hamelinense]MTI42358.1 hypothetical protein [Roseibium hamelinense]TWI89554.1 hypothetical protein JM93_01757 [Roseibium hamelinense]
MARLLRAIRFDASDAHVFPKVAGENEWALPGSFVFTAAPGADPAALTGKDRQAFVSGFLALGSFGFTTIVSVADADETDIRTCETVLSEFLLSRFGAPSEGAALSAARQELAFARDLAEGAPVNTLLALKREIDEEGQVREQFHIVTPPGDKPHARIWDVVEDT